MYKIALIQQWACGTVVARSLSMREVRGSIPRLSIYFLPFLCTVVKYGTCPRTMFIHAATAQFTLLTQPCTLVGYLLYLVELLSPSLRNTQCSRGKACHLYQPWPLATRSFKRWWAWPRLTKAFSAFHRLRAEVVVCLRFTLAFHRSTIFLCRLYNTVVQVAFKQCVHSFRSNKLSGKEKDCVVNAVGKYLKLSGRIQRRVSEVQADQQADFMAKQAAAMSTGVAATPLGTKVT